MEKKLENLKINIFADGANIDEIQKMYDNPLIKGFTTNPSLMKKAGVKNYKNFVQDVINIVKDKPVSFEVFADDDDEIEIQGRKIASIAKNIYIKIPITNTKKKFTGKVIKNLLASNIPLNITAITTIDQIKMLYIGSYGYHHNLSKLLLDFSPIFELYLPQPISTKLSFF